MKYVYILAIAIIATLIILYHNYDKLVWQKSSVDDRYYLVRNRKDKAQAADMLSKINRNMVELSRHIKTKYPNNENVQLILSRYNPDNIIEHIPDWFNPEIAYTLFKGKTFAICVRDFYKVKSNKPKYFSRYKGKVIDDLNTMTFVAIHELAHISTDAIQHPIEFWLLFKFLLKEAVECNIYKPVNYRDYPVYYCKNMKINYNPLYDDQLK